MRVVNDGSCRCNDSRCHRCADFVANMKQSTEWGVSQVAQGVRERRLGTEGGR
jgi:hypothetical protein